MEQDLPDSPLSNANRAALANPDDVLLELSYPVEEVKFLDYLERHQDDIKNIVAWHLKLGVAEIPQLASRNAWLRGNFNINIPVYVHNWSHKPHERVLFRIPFPYKLGETKHHGNVDEKLRCEVATFVWLLDKHPTVPVPFLWGFGFPTGSSFSAIDPMTRNYATDVKQNNNGEIFFASYRPAIHHRHDHGYNLKTGYLIMEFIEEVNGQLLSRHWSCGAEKRDLRSIFFADLARIMLTLSTVKFDSIGSLKFGDNGFLSLTNRPLHFRLQQLENKGVPLSISRSKLYKDTRSYFLDLLACHEQRIRHQRNSIIDRPDAEMQFAVQIAIRAIMPNFSLSNSSNGPFFFRLTDVHPNNVMVDKTGHIKCLIDLEWAVVHPLEFIHPPVWLNGRKIDQLVGPNLEGYKPILCEFLDIFEKEERALGNPRSLTLQFTNTLRWSWQSKAFFYFQGLENPKTCCTLFFQHVLPRFTSAIDCEQRKDLIKAWALLWGLDGEAVIQNRLKDREAYLNELKKRLE